MKKILTATAFSLFIMHSNAFGQQEKSKMPIIEINNFLNYSVKENGINPGDETIELKGDVAIEIDNLKVFKADKVLLNKRDNKVQVFGYCEFAFNGKIVYLLTDSNHKNTKVFEYNSRDSVLYINRY